MYISMESKDEVIIESANKEDSKNGESVDTTSKEVIIESANKEDPKNGESVDTTSKEVIIESANKEDPKNGEPVDTTSKEVIIESANKEDSKNGESVDTTSKEVIIESANKEDPKNGGSVDTTSKEVIIESANKEDPKNGKFVDTTSKEFAYLERNEFTSEIFKIEVRNLGYFGIGEFKKLIKSKLQLDMTKIKSPTRKEFAFVCFRSKEEQLRAIEKLNGYKWKGKVLQASEAKASADPLQKRRKEEQGHGVPAKKQKTSIEATCPLFGQPYEKQLSLKSNNVSNVLMQYSRSLKQLNSEFKKFEHEFVYNKDQLVKAAPQVDGYRNKSEFTVGYNKDNEIVVGFRLGSYADGSVEVSEVHDLPHLPETAKWAASSFQAFVRNSKCYLPFNPESNSGHLRQLMVRTSRLSNEIMIVPGLYGDNLSAEQIIQFQSDLKAYYETAVDLERGFKCTSLYVQDVKRRRPGQMVSPVDHITGSKHITETLFDLKFAISPLAFFQVNTPAAEVLYQTAIELAEPKADSVLLDICCGTGTIALAFAKHCRQVIGVDIVADAVEDAKRNASENCIENSKFYAGNADDTIKSMVREAIYNYGDASGALDLIAVVDPPRSGLHSRSIAAIRATSAIRRLIYISCSPESAKRNWLDLGRPESKQFHGEPFFPKKAVAVDLFPHTIHTELVILFERAAASAEKNIEANVSASNETKQETDIEETKLQESVREELNGL